jgi:hypothetical protein
MSGGPSFDGVVHSITTAVGIAKAMLASERVYDKAELKLKLADLMGELAEARTDLAVLQSYAYQLSDELAAAKKKLAFAGTMVFEAPFYVNTAGGQRDGPYCPACWEGRENLAVHLYKWSAGSWTCNTCKAAFHGPD